MAESRKHQVSLRGASAKEITRDALLQRVSQERELRNYTRRATSAALFIQRVWRSYNSTKMTALQIQQDWEKLISSFTFSTTSSKWISSSLLRPFLFFTTHLSSRYGKIQARDVECMQKCFRILLESLNSTDPHKNFCTLSTFSLEERRTWLYQSKQLISLCLLILAECDYSREGAHEFVLLTSLAMRFLVILTDVKGWKSILGNSFEDANKAVKELIQFLGSSKSGLYVCVRKYISRLDAPFPQMTNSSQKDDKILITASAITLSLRPFHILDVENNGSLDAQYAAEQFCIFLLTIPWFTQRLPSVLLSPLRHKSVLSLCFRAIMISKERILEEISVVDCLLITSSGRMMPQVGWALGNILSLATSSDHNCVGHGKFTQDLDYAMYVHVVIILAENLLCSLEKIGWSKKVNQESEGCNEVSDEFVNTLLIDSGTTNMSLKTTYLDYFRPVCQQSHLMKLLTLERDFSIPVIHNSPSDIPEFHKKWELLDVVYYYFFILKIYSVMNPLVGSLPVLNLLAFTPGFLFNLWEALEESIFPSNNPQAGIGATKPSGNSGGKLLDRKQKQGARDGGNKWFHVLHKITGKLNTDVDSVNCNKDVPHTDQMDEDSVDSWDVETLKCGPEGLSKSSYCLFHLFCATYSHLLLVLDDIEFYEKQVPFTLEQQRKIASMLNTLVYNALSHGFSQQNKTLMDVAIRCLHLLYERDCRHQFCPPPLWLSPARKSRPPIAVAARTHEVLSTTVKVDDSLAVPSTHSVITTTPHVFPFEERVQMFREFISMDKVSRRMAGEVVGPGPQAVEVVIRRGHIVEDGFQQLNSLGSRLKSSIHVSFVSESGLPEAGLDYGGLSKEFLTDIAKAALSPDYGLFSQTSTSDRLLIPNTSARSLENGIQMIEFLGRIVGKALYEGILLDYSFSHVFVQKLLGRYSFLDELSTLDPELYRNLMYLKHYDGDVKELCLDFTVTEESFGKKQTIELKPGGKDVYVTNENRLQYIHAMADYKLNRQVLYLSNAFYRGLTDLISPSWLKLFNASEFNQLLSGGNYDIDVDDLRNNTRYTGGYGEGSRTVKLFWEDRFTQNGSVIVSKLCSRYWGQLYKHRIFEIHMTSDLVSYDLINDVEDQFEVVAGFEPKERCMLLKFATSCSRAPLLGFKYLQPTFTIHKVAGDLPLWAMIGGQDVERLPSASTCYNTLKLPSYKRSSTMRAKLLYAIKSNAGFELS